MVFEYMEADLAGLLSLPLELKPAHVRCLFQQIVVSWNDWRSLQPFIDFSDVCESTT
jgi:hypothetical protein